MERSLKLMSKTIIIHVDGGIITDVFNLPAGHDYVVMDHDCLGDCYPTCEYCKEKQKEKEE
jgi:hypothetical protein